MSEQAKQQEDYVTFYRRALKEFGLMALWSSRPVPKPDASGCTGNYEKSSSGRQFGGAALGGTNRTSLYALI